MGVCRNSCATDGFAATHAQRRCSVCTTTKVQDVSARRRDRSVVPPGCRSPMRQETLMQEPRRGSLVKGRSSVSDSNPDRSASGGAPLCVDLPLGGRCPVASFLGFALGDRQNGAAGASGRLRPPPLLVSRCQPLSLRGQPHCSPARVLSGRSPWTCSVAACLHRPHGRRIAAGPPPKPRPE